LSKYDASAIDRNAAQYPTFSDFKVKMNKPEYHEMETMAEIRYKNISLEGLK